MKFQVTLQLSFEIEGEDECAIDELVEALNEVPLINLGAEIEIQNVKVL